MLPKLATMLEACNAKFKGVALRLHMDFVKM